MSLARRFGAGSCACPRGGARALAAGRLVCPLVACPLHAPIRTDTAASFCNGYLNPDRRLVRRWSCAWSCSSVGDARHRSPVGRRVSGGETAPVEHACGASRESAGANACRARRRCQLCEKRRFEDAAFPDCTADGEHPSKQPIFCLGLPFTMRLSFI